MRVALISSCTSRKKVDPPRHLCARTLSTGPLTEIANEWVTRLSLVTPTVLAKDFYCGRAFSEAVIAADGQSLYVVSAGLGLVRANDAVQPYSLTVSGRDRDNVITKARHSCSPADWWTALSRALDDERPLSRLMSSNIADVFVLALPRTYMELVVDDLAFISAKAAARVRVIGLPSLAACLPSALVDSLVAYDERLENRRTGCSGTRADFAQRAARHFMSSILPFHRGKTAEVHRAEVERFLSSFQRRRMPLRQRISDDEVRRVIRRTWAESRGHVGKGLRVLRRRCQFSCEQSRFKRLFWEVAAEMSDRS
jgi:hypothetical protein